MKAEEYFKDKWPYMFQWIGVDERAMEDIVTSAFRAGAKEEAETWERRMKDRQFLEDELQELDRQDEQREQEDLRRGLA